MPAPELTGTFRAALHRTPPLSVNAFMPAGKTTPGNVAVCLSGGGSRAMTAGMGQLRALETLMGGGRSLLSQTKLLSTVSGGSWVGVPFTYLPAAVSDTSYLGGPYVEPSALTRAGLDALPEGCIAAHATKDFSLTAIAVRALAAHFCGVPADMLWQTIIGLTFLDPYGLYDPAAREAPAAYFSHDASTAAAIVRANPSLAGTPVHTVAQVADQPRPFLLCNMAMAVQPSPLLVPAHGTPFFTGVVGSPPGVKDANGRRVGGGGVTSFAFDSMPVEVDGTTVSVAERRQWSLVDIVGTSSAAFAEELIMVFGSFAESPVRLVASLRTHLDAAHAVGKRLGRSEEEMESAVRDRVQAATAGDLAAHRASLDFGPTDIVPAYRYWPVAGVVAGEPVAASQFADAGSLDNTGIASALSYGDVDGVIAFVNSMTPLSRDPRGVVVVDASIPPLFGYQPYDRRRGYVRYSEPLSSRDNAPFAHDQIFPAEAFAPLIEALWEKGGGGGRTGSPLVRQRLTTVPNAWFGVEGGRAVEVLWVYLEDSLSWSSAMNPEVEQEVHRLIAHKEFPHYDTIRCLELTPVEVNLLANLATWTVMSHSAEFLAMYGY